MSAPGFLAVGGVEIANNARTVGYLARGLGGPWFQTVQSQTCPNLVTEAWPLAVCADVRSDDQFYADPRAGYRAPLTGAVPAAPGLVWDQSGWIMGTGQTPPNNAGLLLPNPGTTSVRVKLMIDLLVAQSAGARSIEVARPIGAGTANIFWFGCGLAWNTGSLTLRATGRTPLGNTGTVNLLNVVTTTGPTLIWLEVIFSAAGFTGRVWGGDPDAAGSVLIGQASYGYSTLPSGQWYTDAGTTEQAAFGAVTEVGILAWTFPMPLATEAVITEIAVYPNPGCVQSALADLFPSDTLWPSDDVYPGLYGTFLDPGTDNAPWIDTDRPEGYGYLGLLIDDITGLDTTSDRSVDQAADGIGGILGPETLAARAVTVKGWLIASDCSAMEYARRWLSETLADALCDGCELSFVDVRTTCGDDTAGDFNTNRWRLYDCGLTGMTTDTSNQEMCCFVTPIEFTITAGDPYLYGPTVTVVPTTLLNASASDLVPVSFETWLFGSGTAQCVTVADQGIGIDAPIFTFTGGTSGIEAGLVYPDLGLYPSDAIWPSDCLTPADGQTQETNDDCPFAFTFSVGPGESFTVDNSRQQLVWTLADGTVLDGSPKLNLATGDVLQWIDTCNGVSLGACAAAYAACTCDDTASVTIQTQHRER